MIEPVGDRNNLHLVDELNRQAKIASAVRSAVEGLQSSDEAIAGISWIMSDMIDSLRAVAHELHTRPAAGALQS